MTTVVCDPTETLMKTLDRLRVLGKKLPIPFLKPEKDEPLELLDEPERVRETEEGRAREELMLVASGSERVRRIRGWWCC